MPAVDRTIPLGPWRPDNADFGAGTLQIARGTIKKADGYLPAPKLITVADAVLPGFADARNLFIGDDTAANQTFRTWAVTGTAIYEAAGSPLVWNDVSKAGGYSTPSEQQWDVAQFGGNIYATNFSDPVQSVNVSVGGLWGDIGGTNVPKARYLAVVRDFLFLGNIDDATDGLRSARVAWSPINNPEGDWDDVATQADRQEVPDLGEITGITGGEICAIFCRNGVERMTYTGDVNRGFFQRDTIDREVGCDYPASVIRVGPNSFCLDRSGWQMFDGFKMTPIGAEWVDDWTFDELRAGQEFRISPAYDKDEKVIRWLFVGQGSQGDVPNRVLMLKPQLGQQGWSYQDVDAYVLGQFVSPGFTMDNMDDPYLDLDTVELPSLDDPFWQSGNPSFGAINDVGKAAIFKGTPADAVWTWAEGQLATAAQRVKLEAALPITVGGSPTVQIGLRDKLQDNVANGPDVTPEDNGDVPLFDEARYHTISMKQTGSWESATALQVSGVTTGNR